MEKLVVVRTNPEQGQMVKVRLFSPGALGVPPDGAIGTAEFSFALWIQFEKLLKDGMEARARIETRETRRIEVEFRVPETPIEAVAPGSFGGVSNLAREEDEMEEDPVTPGAKRLIRSLRGEG